MTTRAVVRGWGSYLPERILTNGDLEKTVETSDTWIVERTGIHQRHIAAEGELTSHMGAKAAEAALKRAGMRADEIDILILATTTPDDTLPATATKIQHAIGMTAGAAFDVNAACSGFVYALAIADGFIRSGAAKRILVIGSETYSRIVDWKDRATCILFGDGAAALVLEAEAGKGTASDRGILFSRLHSDGSYYDILKTTGGVSTNGKAGHITMAGKEVFRHGVIKMADAIAEGLSALGMQLSDIDWIIPHQANSRILSGVARHLNVSEDKLISTVAHHANTSAASIPLAIATAADADRLKRGALIALPALGAGITWGACILRW